LPPPHANRTELFMHNFSRCSCSLFVSSFQMIALGIIGEYVWRGLEASRKRPNFIIEKVQQ